MKLDEILNGPSPDTPQKITQFVSDVLNAEDIDDGQRGPFICGYMSGLAYALQADPHAVTIEILLRTMEWRETGWID